MKNKLKIAINAALQAGFEILKIYNSNDFNIKLKDDNSPLTKADLASNKIIISFLSKTKIPILSEESKIISYDKRKKWDVLWIVDPIDGTKEFIKKNGEFTVNISLVVDQNPVLGVIFAPALGLLYFSSDDIGSFKYEIKSDIIDIDKVISDSVKLPIKYKKIYTVVASKSHLNNETKEFVKKLKKEKQQIDIISAGSSLKFCLLAEGKADCYPRFGPTMEWDTAAGQSICNNVGYSTIDQLTKKEIKYNRKNLTNNYFLVS